MIIYLKDPKDSAKKCLHLINTFRKKAGCKISIQISVGFLYISNEQVEKVIRETIPFTIASKKLIK
jgi:hypothetical protein